MVFIYNNENMQLSIIKFISQFGHRRMKAFNRLISESQRVASTVLSVQYAGGRHFVTRHRVRDPTSWPRGRPHFRRGIQSATRLLLHRPTGTALRQRRMLCKVIGAQDELGNRGICCTMGRNTEMNILRYFDTEESSWSWSVTYRCRIRSVSLPVGVPNAHPTRMRF